MENRIDSEELYDKLSEESDRGLVLQTASLMDFLFNRLFNKFLILDKEHKRIFEKGSFGPLDSLSKKIMLAYSLGFIDKKHYDSLNYIRRIRNEFAHHFFKDFSDDKIADLCSNLTFLKPPGYEPETKRDLFFDAAIYHAAYLIELSLTIEKQKPVKPFQIEQSGLGGVYYITRAFEAMRKGDTPEKKPDKLA